MLFVTNARHGHETPRKPSARLCVSLPFLCSQKNVMLARNAQSENDRWERMPGFFAEASIVSNGGEESDLKRKKFTSPRVVFRLTERMRREKEEVRSNELPRRASSIWSTRHSPPLRRSRAVTLMGDELAISHSIGQERSLAGQVLISIAPVHWSTC